MDPSYNKNKIAIHQPNFIPWPGYFTKIKEADIFVLLDTAEYTKNSFINRNKILLNNQFSWLTIPVQYKGHSRSAICKVKINRSSYRPEKIIKTLVQEYKDYPFFQSVMPQFEEALLSAKSNLSLTKLNERLIRWICNYLAIETNIISASGLSTCEGSASETILHICQQCEGNIYLSGISGKKYLEEELLEEANISIEYQTSSVHRNWDGLSILHWLFIEGPGISL